MTSERPPAGGPGSAPGGADTSPAIDWQATIIPSFDVVAKELEGEVLILDLDSSEYYSLNDVGTAIWGLMSEGLTLERVVGEICDRYSVAEAQVRGDLQSLTQILEEKGLIEIRPPGSSPD